MSALILNFEVDDDFNKTVVERMVQIRKTQGITQIEMAERLGMTQGNYGHYERCFRKLPMERLPDVAKALNTSIEEVLGLQQKNGKRGPKSRLERRFEKIRALPKKEQRFVIEALDRLLRKAS